MDYNKIGLWIANKRKEANLTQKELGEKIHVTDKAVSKWERGLSLPDISILENLAQVLDTTIYEILKIQNKKDIDITKKLEEEQEKLKKQYWKKILKLSVPFLIIILISLFKLIPFGYTVDHIRYTHNTNKLINLGKPKFSFFHTTYQNSFSYKNMRGKNILESEVKQYLNTLKAIPCYNTIYYYDEQAMISIIEYTIKGKLFYNTVTYQIRDGNYCDNLKEKEYKEKLEGLNRMHTLYTEESDLNVSFYLGKEEEEFIATLSVSYYDKKQEKRKTLLENSKGTFEIKNDELYYYRTAMKEKKQDLEIPNTSKFIIKNGKLILQENYLKEYEKSIILK